MEGSCELGNELSSPTKCGEFLEYLGALLASRRTLFHGNISEVQKFVSS
jgi:hypothetical protein